MSTERDRQPEPAATWAGVERAQAESVRAATPAQRLAWLEQAMHLAWLGRTRAGTAGKRGDLD